MKRYFVDSSVLLKRYFRESGSDWFLQFPNRESRQNIVIAQISPVEVTSGLARIRREGRIDESSAKAARLLMQRHAKEEYQVVTFTREIAHQAILLLEKYSLIAYDAVQLASSLAANERFTETGSQLSLTFVSADVRLLTIAEAAGLPTANPNTTA